MAIATIEIIADSRQVRTATQDLRGLEAQGGKTEGATNKISSGFGRAATAAALLGTAVTALTTNALAKYADAAQNIENQLKVVTKSTDELTEAQSRLAQIANESRSGYEATVDLYSKLARSTENLNISSERLFGITETINKSFAVSGASADAARNAIIQLGQGLSAGALRGDEFNSVAEQAPEILRAVSKQTGMTSGELRAFAATGGITAELLIASLEAYGDTVDKTFATSTATISQSLEVANNNTLKFVENNKQLRATASAVGSAIVAVSENLAAIGVGLTAGAAVMTALYVPALYRVVAAKAAVTAASLTMGRAITIATGPIGIFVTAIGAAAAAFTLYKKEADSVKGTELEQIARVKELADQYQRYSKARLGSEAMDIQREQIALDQELAEKQNRLTQLTTVYIDAVNGRVEAGAKERKEAALLAEEVAKLEARKSGLEIRAKAINKAFEDGLPALTDYTDATKETVTSTTALESNFAKLQSALVSQIVELRLGADAYEQYAAAQEIGAGATDAERKNIEQLIAVRQRLTAEVKAADEAARAADAAKSSFGSLTNQLSAENNPAEQARQQLQARLDVIREYAAIEGADKEAALAAQFAAEESYQAQILALRQQANADGGLFAELGQSLSGLQNQVSGTFAQMALGLGDSEELTKRLATTIITELTGAVINYGIQQALVHSGIIAGKAAETAAVTTAIGVQTGAAVAAQGTLTAAAVGSGAGITAAMAPAAAATSIATAGAAPAAAAPIALSTIGAIIAALVGGVALFGRATGGQVLRGNSYLVGERGPELFTPNSSGNGRITPFSQLMSETQNNNNNNQTNANITFVMPEGDGDFVQRLQENRDIIYNIVQRALNERGRQF